MPISTILTKEVLIFPKENLRIKVIKGTCLSLELFKKHSPTADISYALIIAKNKEEYCFDKNVSEYRHYIIKGDVTDIVEHELY